MNPWRPAERLLALAAAVVLSACTPLPTHDRAPARPPDVSGIPDAVPRDEPPSRYGNPRSYEVFGKRYHVMDSAEGYRERGVASWYGEKFHGRRTSSGEPYDMYAMTAAHKTLPLPSYVRVTNLRNEASVIVRVNDRGPFVHNRIIDLSYTAASRLGILENGTGLVEIETISEQSRGPMLAAAPLPEAPEGVPLEVIAREAVAGTGPAADPDPEGGLIFVQLGAFADPLNAHSLGEQLAAVGFDAVRITADPVGERMVYRVRIGPLADVADYDRLVLRLESEGISDFHLAYE